VPKQAVRPDAPQVLCMRGNDVAGRVNTQLAPSVHNHSVYREVPSHSGRQTGGIVIRISNSAPLGRHHGWSRGIPLAEVHGYKTESGVHS
jgi:hypothetical protein